MSEIQKLIETTAKLRSPEGCPWDREQTHQSLKKYLIEETYEVLSAIEEGSAEDILEELGDLLFQICLHSQIKAEQNIFDFEAVAKRVNDKMILRHPHVFDPTASTIESSKDVVDQWEKIKAQEKASQPAASPFASIPKALPSLARALKVLKKADKLKINYTLSKTALDEQINNIQNPEELSQILLCLCERAKQLKIDPEDALRQLVLETELQFSQKTN